MSTGPVAPSDSSRRSVPSLVLEERLYEHRECSPFSLSSILSSGSFSALRLRERDDLL
jgi:hypothetical protein